MLFLVAKIRGEQIDKAVESSLLGCARINRVFTRKAKGIGLQHIDALEDEKLIENLNEIFPIAARQAVFVVEKEFVNRWQSAVGKTADFRQLKLRREEKAALLRRCELLL